MMDAIDRWIPSRGPCLICAITEHASRGEAAEDIAAELELPLESVRAVLGRRRRK